MEQQVARTSRVFSENLSIISDQVTRERTSPASFEPTTLTAHPRLPIRSFGTPNTLFVILQINTAYICCTVFYATPLLHFQQPQDQINGARKPAVLQPAMDRIYGRFYLPDQQEVRDV